MQKAVNDSVEQCPECNVIGMTYRRIKNTKTIFVGGSKYIPQHYHVCENCYREFKSHDERSMNLRLRVIFGRYFNKYEEL